MGYFQKIVSELGINNEDKIVIYDNSDVFSVNAIDSQFGVPALNIFSKDKIAEDTTNLANQDAMYLIFDDAMENTAYHNVMPCSDKTWNFSAASFPITRIS